MAYTIGVLVSFASLPLALNYLGADRFGAWLAISSLGGILAAGDLGIGNGLISILSSAHGRNDLNAAQRYVSTSILVMTAISVGLGVTLFLLYQTIPWPWLLNVSPVRPADQLTVVIAIVLIGALFQIPLRTIESIQIAHQEAFANSFWQAGASLLGLGGLMATIVFDGGFVWFAVCLSGAPVLALMTNGVVLFARRRPGLRPRWSLYSAQAAQVLLRTGSLFFVLQIAIVGAAQVDNLVIAHFLGAGQVPAYAIPMKLFMLIPMVLSFVLAPLWAAYSESLSRGDVDWIQRTFVKSVIITLCISIPMAAALVVFGDRIISGWIGKGLKPSTVLLIGLALWAVVRSANGCVSMFLNGVHALRFQVIANVVMVVFNLGISIVLVARVGLPGPVFGSILAVGLFILVPAAIYIPRLLAGARLRKHQPSSSHDVATGQIEQEISTYGTR